jgi:hypothetical protein
MIIDLGGAWDSASVDKGLGSVWSSAFRVWAAISSRVTFVDQHRIAIRIQVSILAL